MKIALIGSTGNAGKVILKEALNRGHEVIAIVRDVSKIKDTNENLTVMQGDILKLDTLEDKLGEVDILVSAFGPKVGKEDTLIEATNNLITLAKKLNVKRLVTMGGAGSLKVQGDVELVHTEGFPEDWKPIALAHSKSLDIYRNEKEINWTYLSPAALISPGIRTGRYSVGDEYLVVDEKGESKISFEDFAVAMVDEIETPKHIRSRFTVAYK
ncbi:TPA: NAD(P)-dependent oxidoreductase [Clostridium botulinum]|uniref:3-beta hydroxysteroid dehydrogenase n=2 Tax=Clostridium TaxID=1485 RepID=A0A0D1C2H0_CLOBO|nr:MULTISPECIES: NAD(P)-dependent oxidoreductase [Clostridium]MBE6078075.1 NAD(P)-dependent oxidoreductase [Clostridium lundense]AUM94190.1 3-beta hydroxysteroid dehydrogenase [Clostridium sporogenes]AVQ51615.1 NAD(P)-dependent oxidoreductase [Clostridium botulinum]KIS25276.1 3-beta hydroxysteroid dehydrogenase [Clostridium botulinum B2 450]MCW6111269.1 NAD(P)-dependent oxidoreductase [Clostridium sporogenes]